MLSLKNVTGMYCMVFSIKFLGLKTMIKMTVLIVVFDGPSSEKTVAKMFTCIFVNK
jgi:hypothetical protein